MEGRGLRILDRNWRSGRREVDLVVLDGRVVAFVEVKARRAEGPQPAVEALSRGQRRRIRGAAAAWIAAHPGVGAEFRFDLVAITSDGCGTLRIRHLPGAFTGDAPL